MNNLNPSYDLRGDFDFNNFPDGNFFKQNSGQEYIEKLLQNECKLRNCMIDNSTLLKSFYENGDDILNQSINLIRENYYEEFETIIKNNIDTIDKNGTTLLKIAVLCKNMRAIEMIISNDHFNLDINNDIFAFACEINCNEIINLLLNLNNINVNKKGGSKNESPLYYALSNANKTVLTLLLKRDDIDVNIFDFKNIHIIEHAIHNKNNQIALELLKHKNIDLKLLNKYNNLLYLFCQECNIELIEAFFNHGNYSEEDFKEYIDECFLKLVCNPSIGNNILEYFKKVNINYQDKNGNTSIIYACINNYFDKLNYLLGKDADISLTNIFDNNALMYCFSKNYADCANSIFNYLKDKNKEFVEKIINQKNYQNDTCLRFAIKNNSNSMIEQLINLGCDINCYDDNGKTTLLYSIETKNYNLFKFLINNPRIDINQPDLTGQSSLIYAIRLVLNNKNDISYKLSDDFLFLTDLFQHKNININIKDNKGQSLFMFLLDLKYKQKKPVETVNNDMFKGISINNFPEGGHFPTCFTSNMDQWLNNNETINNQNVDQTYKLIDLIIYLLIKRNDLNLDTLDNFGNSVFNILLKNNDIVLFNKIINKININIKNWSGQTYLMQTIDKIKTGLKNNVFEESLCKPDFSIKGIKNPSNDWFEIPQTSVYSKSAKLDLDNNDCYSSNMSFLDSILNNPNLDINLQDYNGNNALFYAILKNDYIVVEKLLTCPKINSSIKNLKEESFLICALKNNSWNIVELLVKKGYDVTNENITNEQKLILNNLVEKYLNKKKGWFS